MHQNLAHAVKFDYQSLDEAFPDKKHGCDPITEPMPHLVLLQIRRAKNMTAGGIALPDEVKQAEASNTQVGKVIAIGSNCFKHPDTLASWKEGPWFGVGDYLRIPRYNGFRFSVKWKVPKEWESRRDGNITVEDIGFVMFEPIHLTGLITGDPLSITAYA